MFAKYYDRLLKIRMSRHYVPTTKKRRRYVPTLPKLSNKPSNTEHPPKDPPEEGYAPGALDHIGFKLPYYIRPAVFRQFESPCEVLGPDAHKDNDYKNAEYFAYHRYSFNELQSLALQFRDERNAGGGKQLIYESEEDDGFDDDDDDAENEDYSPIFQKNEVISEEKQQPKNDSTTKQDNKKDEEKAVEELKCEDAALKDEDKKEEAKSENEPKNEAKSDKSDPNSEEKK